MADRGVGPVFIRCCFHSYLALLGRWKRHFNKNKLLIYLFIVAYSLWIQTAGPGGVTECLTQLGKNNPNRVFR